ncbi:glycosyltransferase family 2 protein [Priestia megaterium]|uniref:glycosyltransferase family 2 protein n=1 Tax=Priestia megaterium TaxID=1404 RepID=UPI000CA21CC1|nr:glycosyltransferase family 2 protein [Priestia megaterium]AUO12999.1 glycosyltransferase family 2 protein [Priestia megaterium]
MNNFKFQLDQPLVSIITPAYNCAAFISSTIKSVQQQTYLNWELLVIEDCSTDETAEVVKKFSRKDQRIQLLQLTKNSGAAAARNEGISAASGRFLAFLDSDDVWHTEKLAKQVAFMLEKNCAFSYTGYSIMDEKGEETGVEVNVPKSVDYRMLAGNTIIGCLTVMLDKKQISEISMPNIQPEDTALWLSLLRKGYTAYGLQESLAYYRLVSHSVSSNKLKAATRYWKLLRKQERLPLWKSATYFVQYSVNAYAKSKNLSKS